MKNYLAFIFIVFLLAAGCSNDGSEESGETEVEEGASESQEQSNEQEEENEQTDQEETATTKNPFEDVDELNVQFQGTATYENHHLTVEGTTNLPTDASIFIYPQTLDNSTFMGVSGSTRVNQDGSFTFEQDIPEEYKHGLNVQVRFRPEDQTSDSIKEKYGETGENLEGPFVRKYNVSDAISKQASTSVHLPLHEGESVTKEITNPNWKKPDDYGKEKVRIEADVTTNTDFVNITGKSNLIEGSELSVSIRDSDGGRTGSSDKIRVNPDGSYRTQLENPSDQEDLTNHYVEVKFAPTEYSWSTVWENYGKKGENMNGSLVEDWTDSQRAVLEVQFD